MSASVRDGNTPENEVIRVADLLNHLPALDGLLRAHGFAHDSGRWLRIHELWLEQTKAGSFPNNHAELRSALATLLCRSEADYERFPKLYEQWCAQLPKVEKAPPTTTATVSSALPPPTEPTPVIHAVWTALLTLTLLIGVIGLWANVSTPQATRSDEKPTATITDGETPPPPPQPADSLELVPIPPREGSPPPYVAPTGETSPLMQWILDHGAWLLATAPLLIWLLMYVPHLLRIVLKRDAGPFPPILERIRFPNNQIDLFASESLRRSLRRLFTPVAATSRQLDLPRTVENAAREGGLFAPIFSQRRSIPECLVLYDLRHDQDHLASMAQLLVARLKEAGLEAYGYGFRELPMRVLPMRGLRTDGDSWMDLTRLAQLHRDARLFLIGEPSALIDLWRDRPHRITAEFNRWHERTLLSTQALAEPLLATLAAQGFSAFPFTSDGLADAIRSRFDEGQTAAEQHAPLLPTTLRLLDVFSVPDAAEQRSLLAELAGFLGLFGMRLFSAMAAYPGLHWGLTIALDRGLFPPSQDAEDQAIRESRLRRLSVLPWSREPSLPEWLRAAALNSLTDKEFAAVQGVYASLKQQAERVDASTREWTPRDLTIATASPEWWKYWNREKDRKVFPDPMADHIFASLMLGKRPRRTEFELPKRLFRYLPKQLHRISRDAVLSLGVALAASAAVAMVWQTVGLTVVRDLLGAPAPAPFSTPVTIQWEDDARDLAIALREHLRERGYVQVELADTDTGVDTSYNYLEVAVGADQAANDIAKVLGYLSYNSPVDIRGTVASGVAVTVATPSVQGQAIFRDVFNDNRAIEQKGVQASTTVPATTFDSVILLSTGNIAAVTQSGDGPPVPAAFEIERAHRISHIDTYHWNDGQGSPPGQVSLQAESGKLYGPWQVRTSSGQNDAPNVNWLAEPNVVLPAGTYTLIDSEPSTWSFNEDSGNRGFTTIKGTEVTDNPEVPAQARVYVRYPSSFDATRLIKLKDLLENNSVTVPRSSVGTTGSRNQLFYLREEDADEANQMAKLLTPLLGDVSVELRSSTTERPRHFDLYLATPDSPTPDIPADRAVIDLESSGPAQPDSPPNIPLPEMVEIPGGTFLMGSPPDEPGRGDDEQQHKVTVAPFLMSKTEITFEQYDAFATVTNRELPEDEGWGRGQRPVINVSWEDAQTYVDWLSENTGRRYRLPTEAEWEYAARAGTTTPFYTGDCLGADQANYQANYPRDGCPRGEYRAQTLPVGSFAANPFGLVDMHGNVWEWMQDCFEADYSKTPDDGSAHESNACATRVLRSGSWDDTANARSAYRSQGQPDARTRLTGIRVVAGIARARAR